MRTVQLSKTAIAGTVANYWHAPEVPDNIYIALENSIGFGEGPGGFGVGSVVNALFDLEGGFFFQMARIDELLLNIPNRDQVARELSGREGDPGAERQYWLQYPWQFAEDVHGIRIVWE